MLWLQGPGACDRHWSWLHCQESRPNGDILYLFKR